MEQKQIIRQHCQQFNLTGMSRHLDDIITEAENKSWGYMDYTVQLLRTEAEHRQQRDIKKTPADGQFAPSARPGRLRPRLLQWYQHYEGSSTQRTALDGPDLQHHPDGALWHQ